MSKAHEFGFGPMQSFFVFRGLLVEKLDLPRGPLKIRVPLHVDGRKRREYAGGPFRAGVLVADLNKVRLLHRFNIQALRQLANGLFDLGWAIGVRGVCGNKSRHCYNLLQEVFVAQEFDFGIEFFFSNVGAGEIHGAGGLGRDDGVKAATAQKYLEVRFISRREDDEEHRRQHNQPKRSGYESRTLEERGRQIAERQGKRGVRVSVQFRGHGSYSKADHTRRALWELARF